MGGKGLGCLSQWSVPAKTPGHAPALPYTQCMEAPWCPNPESSVCPSMPAALLGSRGWRLAAAFLNQQARSSPTHPPAGCRPVSSSRLWPDPSPEQNPEHRCSYSLTPDELLEKKKISEPVFLNPPLSEEKRDPSLLWLRASGCLPSGASHRLQVHAALVCTAGCWPKSLQRDGD